MPPTPIPLRQAIKPGEIACRTLHPPPIGLGSFWVNSNDVQSSTAKFMKKPSPPMPQNTVAQALAHAYAVMLAEKTSPWQPGCVVRVLASREARPDPDSPLAWIARYLGDELGIPVAEPFFRTDSRRSMRYVARLSGPDALKPRLEYVIQDLCILPQPIPQKVLLLDDIYNLGASARIYTEALKRFCSASDVLSMNLAITRFHGGKDGWGYLSLDIEHLTDLMANFLPPHERHLASMVYVLDRVIHTQDCPLAKDTEKIPAFLAPKDAAQCPECHRKEGWWKRLISGGKAK